MESTKNRLSKNRSVARAYREEVRNIWACSVLGSKSLTRCLGMPPKGEIAVPTDKKYAHAARCQPLRNSKAVVPFRGMNALTLFDQNRERSCAAPIINTATWPELMKEELILEKAGLGLLSDLPNVDRRKEPEVLRGDFLSSWLATYRPAEIMAQLVSSFPFPCPSMFAA
jgi:hypothetical protein